jgi:hypothetical protein
MSVANTAAIPPVSQDTTNRFVLLGRPEGQRYD